MYSTSNDYTNYILGEIYLAINTVLSLTEGTDRTLSCFPDSGQHKKKKKTSSAKQRLV